MEGSRHEKAALVVASYVIGVITTFIFFATSMDNTAVSETFIGIPEINTAAVIEAVPNEIEDEEVVSEGSLSYTDGRLEMSMPDGVHLLSFNPETSGLETDVDSLTQGVHYGEIVYKMSDDNNFVFFCEKQSSETSSCSGYVYEVEGDRIFQVIKDGKAVTISPKSASEAIWTAVGLKIGSSYSANKSAPWVLISEEAKLDLE